jgi:hypothetical protein
MRSNAWTDEEIALLKLHYPKVGSTGCVPYLPKRTYESIRDKAHKLGIKMMRWTKEEKDLLRAIYPEKGLSPELIAMLPRHHKSAIKAKISAIGLRIKHEPKTVRDRGRSRRKNDDGHCSAQQGIT